MRRVEKKKTGGGWNQKEKTETPETKVLWNGVEGVPGHPDVESRHELVQVKSSRRESEAPG